MSATTIPIKIEGDLSLVASVKLLTQPTWGNSTATFTVTSTGVSLVYTPDPTLTSSGSDSFQFAIIDKYGNSTSTYANISINGSSVATKPVATPSTSSASSSQNTSGSVNSAGGVVSVTVFCNGITGYTGSSPQVLTDASGAVVHANNDGFGPVTPTNINNNTFTYPDTIYPDSQIGFDVSSTYAPGGVHIYINDVNGENLDNLLISVPGGHSELSDNTFAALIPPKVQLPPSYGVDNTLSFIAQGPAGPGIPTVIKFTYGYPYYTSPSAWCNPSILLMSGSTILPGAQLPVTIYLGIPGTPFTISGDVTASGVLDNTTLFNPAQDFGGQIVNVTSSKVGLNTMNIDFHTGPAGNVVRKICHFVVSSSSNGYPTTYTVAVTPTSGTLGVTQSVTATVTPNIPFKVDPPYNTDPGDNSDYYFYATYRYDDPTVLPHAFEIYAFPNTSEVGGRYVNTTDGQTSLSGTFSLANATAPGTITFTFAQDTTSLSLARATNSGVSLTGPDFPTVHIAAPGATTSQYSETITANGTTIAITGAPGETVSITASVNGAAPSTLTETLTGTPGTYNFTNLAPGNYVGTINWLTTGNSQNFNLTIAAPSVSIPIGQTSTTTTTHTVVPSTTTTPATVATTTQTYTQSISGSGNTVTVTGAPNDTVSTTYSINNGPASTISATLNGTGNYSFPGLPPGNYTGSITWASNGNKQSFNITLTG
jgi:hypothetical protein